MNPKGISGHSFWSFAARLPEILTGWNFSRRSDFLRLLLSIDIKYSEKLPLKTYGAESHRRVHNTLLVQVTDRHKFPSAVSESFG